MPSRLTALLCRFGPLGLLLTVAVATSGCGGSPAAKSADDQKDDKPREVQVAEAQAQIWPTLVRVQGSLLGDEQSVIGAKISGRVEKVHVDLGSVVREGEPLVTLDRRELTYQVEQADAALRQACAAVGLEPADDEAKLNRQNSPPVVIERSLYEEAQAKLKRAEPLRGRRAISEEEYAQLETQVKTAEARYRSAMNNVEEKIAQIGMRRAELALARQKLADAQVLAPFDGIVERKQVAPGQYVQLGDTVVTLVRTDRLRFTAGVPERRAARIQTGQVVRINLGTGTPIETVISRVSPAVNQTSRSLWIEADVSNPNRTLRAGLFAEAEIVVDPNSRALTVPESALSEFAGIEKVWVVEEGKAVERPVRTGRREADRVEIIEGLSAGEDVIVSDERSAGPVVIAERVDQEKNNPGTLGPVGVAE